MENNKNIRLIDELGRIVVPIEVRQAMDWGGRTPVEIWVNATKDEVVIKKHTFSCTYCGNTESLNVFDKKYICTDCQKKIAKL